MHIHSTRGDMHSSAPPIAIANMEWRKIPVPLSELCLSSVLRCGQSFRWKSSGEDEWSCALSGRIMSLRQDPTHLYYRTVFPSSYLTKKEDDAVDDTVALIRDYFNLSINLTELYEKWSSRDPHFKKKALSFTGIRMLRQDPWENLISFICSSNNNISRIGQMVENLCITFGTKLGQLGDTPYYDFPAPSTLTPSGVEEKLRALGFGYRAKYIHQTARIVASARPTGWLDGLKKVSYKDAHEALLELQGVGPKVADCVCLMSLDKMESVPVDTHVWQIAMRDYKFGKGNHKSLTKATYVAIGDHFRELWGSEAGWAHSVLFAADLKAFADKEITVEKSVTSTTITMTAKRERKAKPEVKDEGDDVENMVSATTVAIVKRGMEVNLGADAETTVAVKMRAKKAKVDIKREMDDTANQLIGAVPVKTVKKRGKKSKIRIKEEDEEDYPGADVTLEKATEEVIVEASLKRSLEIREEGLSLEMENVGLTMADRIKRRRRR